METNSIKNHILLEGGGKIEKKQIAEKRNKNRPHLLK